MLSFQSILRTSSMEFLSTFNEKKCSRYCDIETLKYLKTYYSLVLGC